MKRRLFTFASALSLLLCVATMALWARSHNTFDDLDRVSTSLSSTEGTHHYIRLGSTNGRLIFTRRKFIWPSYNPLFSQVTSGWDRQKGVHFTHRLPLDLDREFDIPNEPTERSWEWRVGEIRFKRLIEDAAPANTNLRPRFYSGSSLTSNPGEIGIAIIVPHAYIAALLAILPVIALLKWRRRPRRKGCASCGYDLTGNTSGVCPECGTAVANVPAREA